MAYVEFRRSEKLLITAAPFSAFSGRLKACATQAGSLCYIAFRIVEQSLRAILKLAPCTKSDSATA
jgi:hypothetical protein